MIASNNNTAIVALRVVNKRIQQMRDEGETDLRFLRSMIGQMQQHILDGKDADELWKFVKEDDE